MLCGCSVACGYFVRAFCCVCERSLSSLTESVRAQQVCKLYVRVLFMLCVTTQVCECGFARQTAFRKCRQTNRGHLFCRICLESIYWNLIPVGFQKSGPRVGSEQKNCCGLSQIQVNDRRNSHRAHVECSKFLVCCPASPG